MILTSLFHMSIDPEIIPDSSNDGSDAISIFKHWHFLIVFLLCILALFLILKAIVPILLMILGISYLFTQYRKILAKK